MFIGLFLSYTFATTWVTKPTQDSSGMTLVMLAAAGGQDDLLRLLLRKGAKVNGRQKNGTTALIHAAEKVGHAACCAFLVLETESVSVEQCAGHSHNFSSVHL